MIEPAYSFTIPSTEDDTTLDCRLYHPEDISHAVPAGDHGLNGAVIAHPYAPLGGCYDDPVVLRITSNLVSQGYVVVTFNFRGAGGSQGSTSWSGRGEKDDYISAVGVLLYYLRALSQQSGDQAVEVPDLHTGLRPLSIVLGGYSYGSLILSKLPPLETMTKRFETAAIGSSAAEVILRARRLATETLHAMREASEKHTPRGRPAAVAMLSTSSPDRSRAHSATVTVGGEETDASERRLSSRDHHHAVDFVKKSVEVPHRIKMHLRRRSSSRSGNDSLKSSQKSTHPAASGIKLRYLLISPVLAPLAHALVPPSHMSHLFGHHKDVRDPSSGFGALEHPTLAVWGGQDGFTSAKKLAVWIDKLQAAAPNVVQGVCIETAGHFWREHGVMKELLQHISTWMDAETP